MTLRLTMGFSDNPRVQPLKDGTVKPQAAAACRGRPAYSGSWAPGDLKLKYFKDDSLLLCLLPAEIQVGFDFRRFGRSNAPRDKDLRLRATFGPTRKIIFRRSET